MLTIMVPTVLFSQSVQISGLVSDSSGAVIPGATVTLTKDDTGIHHVSTSNADGQYSIPAAQPGIYKIRVSRAGFRTAIRMGVKLDVGESARIDFVLRAGILEDSVVVTANLDLLDRQGAAVGTVIGRDLIDSLPLSGRGLLTLLEVTPEVLITPATSGVEGGQFSAAGQRADANYFTVDGVSGNNGVELTGLPGAPAVQQTLGGALPAYTALGSMQSLVSLEAIEEFRIETSSSGVDAGRMTGAHLSIVTRSGTNYFHGSFFNYFRNEALDGNDWFANQAGQGRGPFRLNDFGGTFGGPILRNRTFFFVSQEDLRLDHSIAEMQYLPTLGARTGAPPVDDALLEVLPLPNGPEISPGLASYAVNAPRWSALDSTSARIDHTFSPSTQLFARFNRSPSEDNQDHPGALAESRLTMNAEGLTVGLDLMLSPSTNNTLRLNDSEVTNESVIETNGINLVQYAPAITPPNQTSYSLGVLSLGLVIANDEAKATQRQWNLVDTLNVMRGRHLFQLGADGRRLSPSLTAMPYGVASFYSDLNALAAGDIALLTVSQRNPVAMRLSDYSLFAGDAWKVSTRFTLTYGLHWELNPAPAANNGAPLFASVNLNDSIVQFAAKGSSLWRTGAGNFAPRVGGALRLRPRTVLRAGAGVYYDLGFGPALETAITQVSDSFSNVSVNANPAVVKPVFNATGPNLSSASAIVSGFRTPVSIQWNTTLEQEIANRAVLSASYVGSADRRLLRKDLVLFPDLGYAGVFTNQGQASYQALQVQARSRFHEPVQGIASFTWAHSIDNSSQDGDLFSPDAAWGGTVDKGNSAFDIRLAFSAAVTYELPGFSKRERSWLLGWMHDWSLSGTFLARTGFPITVYGLDSYFPSGEETRPDLIAGQPIWIPAANVPGGRILNRDAFVLPNEFVPGTLGRNSIAGPGMSQLDLAIQRQFTLSERWKAQFRIETFNTLNHPNFGNPDAFLGDPTFGQSVTMLDQFLGLGGPSSGLAPALQIGGPRSVQLAVRFRF
jgi:hypothetical protein